MTDRHSVVVPHAQFRCRLGRFAERTARGFTRARSVLCASVSASPTGVRSDRGWQPRSRERPAATQKRKVATAGSRTSSSSCQLAAVVAWTFTTTDGDPGYRRDPLRLQRGAGGRARLRSGARWLRRRQVRASSCRAASDAFEARIEFGRARGTHGGPLGVVGSQSRAAGWDSRGDLAGRHEAGTGAAPSVRATLADRVVACAREGEMPHF